MRYVVVAIVLLAVVAGGGLAWALRFPEIAPIEPPAADSFDRDVVDRGETLAAIGCAECHTPPGGKPFGGGLALNTPFGVIHTSNITPDPETGIGSWSAAAFRRALHQGVNRRGGYLYPAFPYDHFTKLSDEDVDAIYAYLMTRKPVTYRAPAPEFAFPFNQRILLAGWNLLFLHPGRYQPDPSHSDAWNRGAYLAALAHCGSCHTPRNALGGEIRSRRFAGAGFEGWHAPALDAQSPAPVPWNQDAMVNYLLDGWDQDHGIASGPMTLVVNELFNISEDDAYAIAEYILSFQPQTGDDARAKAARAFAKAQAFGGSDTPADGPAIDAGAEPGLADGAATFARICANCHRAGTRTTPLALSSNVSGPDPSALIHVVEEGIKPPEGSFDRTMPALGGSLSDRQFTNLVTFVRSHFSQRPAWQDVSERVHAMRAK
jgi:mono/diheme cytochrome c family protein